MNAHECLIMFTKYPNPGKVKTRLIPALGQAGAARIHKEMAQYVFRWLERASAVRGCELEVWFDGATGRDMERFLNGRACFFYQGEGDLGQRMRRAFEGAFARGVRRAVVVGSDCPTIKDETIISAFNMLLDVDIVLGPAFDGGYYLIGMSKPNVDVLTDIPWGSDRVFEATKARIQNSGATLGILQTMGDVDVPSDLHIWEEARKTQPPI